ncbi:MAG: hypothetical protein E3J64_05715 [Anaerolineales bacterium]|nr:MAG: hypothetical protein E3J64_05715 [Anaerolineales bacterium]
MASSRYHPFPPGRPLEVAEPIAVGLVDRSAVARARARVRGRTRRPLLLLLVLVLVGAAWVALSDGFYVYGAETVGAQRLAGDDLLLASGLVGKHTLTIRPRSVEAGLLAALPTLKSVEVSCRIPASCTIVVEEREPVAVWEEGGVSYWIDEEGMIFPFEGMRLGHLFFTGPLPRGEDGRVDEGIHGVVMELVAGGIDSDVVFRYDAARGFVMTDSRGWQVVLGSGPGMAEKLAVLEGIVDSLEARGLTPRFVDVRFPSAPYYSLNGD